MDAKIAEAIWTTHRVWMKSFGEVVSEWTKAATAAEDDARQWHEVAISIGKERNTLRRQVAALKAVARKRKTKAK